MAKAKAKTSSKGTRTRVRHATGRSYKVCRAEDDKEGANPDRSVSIRTDKWWRLGTLEEGTTFHASHKHGKRKWVWGYATSGPGGTPHLSYADHSQCGWVLRANLERFKRGEEPPYKPPPITYKRWNDGVYRSIQFLYVNCGGRLKPTKKQREKGEPGTPRKNIPVPTRRASKTITAHKNSHGRGEEFIVEGPVGVRYLSKDGFYMAFARGHRWCFIAKADLEAPDETRACKFPTSKLRNRNLKACCAHKRHP